MPYPMVHLAVTQRMAELLQTELPPEFYLGSLAPDSIHMREGTDKTDKSVTHLKLMPRNLVPPELDLPAFLHSFITSHTTSADLRQAAFIKGYVSHVLTDLYWLDTLYDEFKLAVEPRLGKPGRVELYKRECDQGDYQLYLQCAWRPMVWDLLQKAAPFAVGTLLSADEVRLWKERVLNIYEVIAALPSFELEFMTVERLTHFANQAAQEMLRQFDRIGIPLFE